MGQQIKKALQKIALPDDSFAEAYDALGQMTRKASQPVAQLKFELDKQLPLLKVKQDRLLNAHLEGLIDKAEYRKTKTYLINKEMDLRTKLTNLEKGATGWLEPAQNFLRTAHSVGKLLASDAHLIEQKDFLKKTGSNFRVGGRRLSFEFKNPWRLLLDFSCNSNPLAGGFRIPGGSSSSHRPPPADEIFSKTRYSYKNVVFLEQSENLCNRNARLCGDVYTIKGTEGDPGDRG